MYRALIVDDEHQVRYATARALGRLGFDCQLARNGRDALELLRRTNYDLVVTDLKMPDVNGHKLATALLSLESPPTISVLTGVVEPKLAKDLTTRGVDRVFFKPVDYIEFASDLLSLVEQRKSSCSDIESDGLLTIDGNDRGAAANNSAQSNGPRPEILEPTADVLETTATSIDRRTGQQVLSAEPDDRSNLRGNNSRPKSEEKDRHNDGSVYVSSASANKIEMELSRTKKALTDLERTVAAGQNLSYFCLAIALGAGLLSGLILGWLGSQLLAPTAGFK